MIGLKPVSLTKELEEYGKTNTVIYNKVDICIDRCYLKIKDSVYYAVSTTQIAQGTIGIGGMIRNNHNITLMDMLDVEIVSAIMYENYINKITIEIVKNLTNMKEYKTIHPDAFCVDFVKAFKIIFNNQY